MTEESSRSVETACESQMCKTLHIIRTIGQQCVQRVTATWLSGRIACLFPSTKPSFPNEQTLWNMVYYKKALLFQLVSFSITLCYVSPPVPFSTTGTAPSEYIDIIHLLFTFFLNSSHYTCIIKHVQSLLLYSGEGTISLKERKVKKEIKYLLLISIQLSRLNNHPRC